MKESIKKTMTGFGIYVTITFIAITVTILANLKDKYENRSK